ncbi:hypothetical protein J4205_01940 [Candidatus Pacearchaeota archaeon]|nr:hypothetical protein [Candidatus Pacearchaeota archaeon]
MEVKILSEDKNVIEVEIDNLTVTETIREYLNKDKTVEFAAWKRSHPNNPPMLRVQTKGKSPIKAIQDAIDSITKDINSIASEAKKA